ncbi:MAG TPA: 4-hydroxy-3-methylbut-2-enyl diphosphate reductase [Planctomycetaceae bacterium]|nr:4-hydroxy-3-methylbut-2-enyl diphosphate reductase [Planctomycetaceae bacterium]
MQVIRADALGFCFGVRDALEVAQKITSPAEVTIRGELVHNASVNQLLQSKGFVMNAEHERESIPATPLVMLTAHGVSQRERARLLSAGKQLIDTTCPLVRNVQQAARRLEQDGFFVVVIGRAGHVEVEGIVGDLERCCVVGSVADVQQWNEARLGIVCQTTTPPRLAEEIVLAIKDLHPEAEICYRNTICQPTLDRQRAVEELADRVDLMVVAGGINSHNTNQLAELCRSRDVPVVRIQTAADLVPGDFAFAKTVGLTAGTSTPDAVIEEVESRLNEIGQHQKAAIPTSIGWIVYFQKNRASLLSIPWETLSEITPEEREAIGKSIQIFQRGESGEGLHFLKCAERHSRAIADSEYVPALRLFIQEEQRHAADLARVLDALGLPRLERDWTDSCFRWLRHRAGLDLTISVLLTAEVLAVVYYAALAKSTPSPALHTLCRQILRDEVMHIRFQTRRLFELREKQSKGVRKLKLLLQSALFDVTSLVLWSTHRPVFRAAKVSFRDYRRQCRREWGKARDLIESEIV